MANLIKKNSAKAFGKEASEERTLKKDIILSSAEII